MLDEFCPIQFVEGFNEGAEPSGEDNIIITRYLETGIQYIATFSYILEKLEVMMTFGSFPEESKLDIKLYSDYNEKPSDIILSSGSLIPKNYYGGWHEVELQPVSVIKNNKYWITILPNGCPTELIRAVEGESLLINVRAERRWRTPPEDMQDSKVMLRLYGRIIPLAAS